MARIRTLIFHGAIAPYRVDLFNRLHNELDLHMVFFNRGIYYQPNLNNDALRAQMKGNYEYLLKGIHFLGRDIRIGMGRIIEEFQPQVVVTPEFSYNTLYIILYRKLKATKAFGHVICTEENLRLLKSRGLIRRALRKVCCNAAHALIIYTDQARKAFPPSWMSQEQIFVAGNDQDENIFIDKLKKARTVVDDCVRKHKLLGKNVILFLGRFVQVKNLPRLLEAFARVSAKNYSAVLVLGGGGPDEEMLRKRAAQLGITDKTIILGHQEEEQLHVWYLISSMLVLPSTSETYGAVVNESLISGLPVLCSTHAGTSVLIREGENGDVFDPYDVVRLSQLIEDRLKQAQTAEVAGHCDRENLMPISFEEDVASFIKAVECAARRVGKR